MSVGRILLTEAAFIPFPRSALIISGILERLERVTTRAMRVSGSDDLFFFFAIRRFSAAASSVSRLLALPGHGTFSASTERSTISTPAATRAPAAAASSMVAFVVMRTRSFEDFSMRIASKIRG